MGVTTDQLPTPVLVAAVVVTYNRFDTLLTCLESVHAQRRPPDLIVVVDNASPDRTPALLRDRMPEIDVVEHTANLGVGAGMATGMERARSRNPTHYWMVEDDTTYSPDYLERALDAMERNPRIAMLGYSGWRCRHGLWRREPVPDSTDPLPQDLVLLDGAVLRGDVVAECGYPRADYFMMIQDIEYPLRLRDGGHQGFVWSELQATPLKLGAHASPGESAYRAYYQTRNHLRMAIDRRSPVMGAQFLRRQLGLAYSDVRSGATAARLRLRAGGIVDGARGAMGVRVAPGATEWHWRAGETEPTKRHANGT